MIRWKLKEVMARYDVTGVSLAQELNLQEASISHLKKSKTIPAIGGDRIENLCKALSKLSGQKIKLIDLYEED